MGLDVRVYENVVEVTDESIIEKVIDKEYNYVDDEYYDDYFYRNMDNDDDSYFYFLRAEPIRNGGLYIKGEYHHIFSRSYGGYNQWRERLAKIMGYPEVEYSMYEGSSITTKSHAASAWGFGDLDMSDKPFYEMINFTDCDGILGSVVCKKLYQDFVDNEHIAKQWSEHTGDEYFLKGYNEFMHGFEIAARTNGLMEFG